MDGERTLLVRDVKSVEPTVTSRVRGWDIVGQMGKGEVKWRRDDASDEISGFLNLTFATPIIDLHFVLGSYSVHKFNCRRQYEECKSVSRYRYRAMLTALPLDPIRLLHD